MHQMRKVFVAIVILGMMVGQAQAVTLAEIIRNCRADGKTYCPNSSYGKPMQACLSEHMSQLSPSCKDIVARLNKGEKVSFF
jgi:hypothetical protein